MKIHGNSPLIQLMQKAQETRPNTSPASSQDSNKRTSEKVTISENAAMAQAIHKQMEKAPDVRIDKVNQIKGLVEAGKYERPADQVAEKLISTSLIESLYR